MKITYFDAYQLFTTQAAGSVVPRDHPFESSGGGAEVGANRPELSVPRVKVTP
ncbi:hypothetical protein BN970_04944 [Mycolicibacterium conceptionense]|uniref:Uncharacterized protein n=1 Tax=Mycolicibacterium conceptionense TaxID=451644 RepID=A0A0U1DR73_9MYCO|nr:hypothetical protein BN970_04944 [Mycolicibacterium conceptionense]